MAGHGPVLSSKQLGRLGGGLPAVLGCVFLCCRQPALKVSQLALEVLLLALKVLYERLKVWGRGATRARHPPAPALTSPPPRTEEGSGPGDGVRRSLSFSLYAASAAAFACLVHSYQRLRGKRPLSAALMDC